MYLPTFRRRTAEFEPISDRQILENEGELDQFQIVESSSGTKSRRVNNRPNLLKIDMDEHKKHLELEKLKKERLEMSRKQFVYESKLLKFLENGCKLPEIEEKNEDLLVFRTLEQAKWDIIQEQTLKSDLNYQESSESKNWHKSISDLSSQ